MNKYILLFALLLTACQEQTPEPTPEPEPIPAPSNPAPEPTPEPEPTKWARPLPKPIPEWGKKPVVMQAKYVCSKNGLDTNDGSLAAPYETIERGLQDFRNGENLLLCRGGKWEPNSHSNIVRVVNQEHVYLGAYGEGERPHLKYKDNGFRIEHSTNIYIDEIDVEGAGFWVSGTQGHAFTVGAGNNNIVLDNIAAHDFRVGIIAGGEENFLLRNSEIYKNSTAGFYGSFNKSTFLHENEAWSNGGGYTDEAGEYQGGGGHNYYISGHWNVDTSDFVFQRNISKDAAPQFGPEGGKCVRGPFVTHGYVRDLYIVDNIIIEKKGNSGGGCWGLAVDAGRNEAWGDENFINLTVTGNHLEYTGNLLIGLSNADEALVGWNTGIVDATQQGVGLAAPDRGNEDEATKIETLTVVHNNFHIDGKVLWNSTGIRLNNIAGILENNTVTFNTPQRKVYCYWLQTGEDHLVVEGKTDEVVTHGDNNKCLYSEQPTFASPPE